MRFLHTSDWHLGRLLFEARLLDDQAHLLDQVFLMARDLAPDFLLVAGDIYDKAVPPQDAVELLGDFLSRLALDLKVPALLLAGNHDSAQRLGFCARVLSERGVVISGTPSEALKPRTFYDAHGPVEIHLLPYVEPAQVRELFPGQEPKGHDEAMATLINALERNQSRRSIIAAHAFVAGGGACDSERPLSVGGTGAVEMGRFNGFDYVALGHLHRPQKLGNGKLQYSGSLFKYSFSEVDHRKRINLVEMDATGTCTIEPLFLSPRRDLRKIEGTLEELLSPEREEGSRKEDYLEAILTDAGPLLQPMERLRKVYPNILHIERPSLRSQPSARYSAVDHRRMSDLDLFRAFFDQVVGRALTTPEESSFQRALLNGAGIKEISGNESKADPATQGTDLDFTHELNSETTGTTPTEAPLREKSGSGMGPG